MLFHNTKNMYTVFSKPFWFILLDFGGRFGKGGSRFCFFILLFSLHILSFSWFDRSMSKELLWLLFGFPSKFGYDGEFLAWCLEFFIPYGVRCEAF